MKRSLARTLIALIAFACSIGIFAHNSFGQDVMPEASPPNDPLPSIAGEDNEGPPVDVQADQMNYEYDRNVLICVGNVEVTHKGDLLKADYMEYHTQTQDLYAKGNVYMEQDGRVWEGEELTYNLRTRRGDFGGFAASVDMYHITAADSKRVSEDEILLEKPTISTCVGNPPEFYIKAGSARVFNDSHIRAQGVIFYVFGVPFMYIPIWKHSLGKESNFDFVPGYSSRHGAFLLSAYNYRFNDYVRASTHVDYRSKRGFAYGQDLFWKDPAGTYKGSIKGYYVDDDSPFEGEPEPTEEELDLIDNQRYRLRLQHTQSFTPRDVLRLDAQYQSDPDIIEDFFDEEFRESPQPENRLTLTHYDEGYTAGFLINKRLNDFYSNIDRVPELTLDFQRQRIGQSPFYYEGENSVSFLDAVASEQSGDEDVDTFRADSSHKIIYPTRHFGFLNLIPRAGYRGTYYGDTYENSAVTNISAVTDTNGIVTGVETNIDSVVLEAGSEFRSVFELGMESSFKAFKVWDGSIFHGDVGTRHVVEPFANYTLIPEPNVTPDELFDYDSIDRIGERHDIGFGVRNKIQTKRRGRVHDLIDFIVSSSYDLNAEGDEEEFGDISFDTELRLTDWLLIDADADYDHVEGNFRNFNTQVGLLAPDESSLSLEYRFKNDRSSLLAGELILWPEQRWSLSAYGRYEFETGILEEQSYLVVRKTDCLGIGVGVKEIDEEDVTAWFQVWLTAFPETAVALGR